jgi:hypothetical protein
LPDYGPTVDHEAVDDVGHLVCVCEDVLELVVRRPAEEFGRLATMARTIPDVLPKFMAAATYLIAEHRHLEERIG